MVARAAQPGDEGKARQLSGRERLAPAQRMIRRDHQPERLAPQELRLQPVRHARRQHHAELRSLVAHELEHILDGADASDDPHVGALAGEGAERRRQDRRRHVAVHGDADLTCPVGPDVGERQGRLLRLAQHVERESVERLAGLGQLRFAAALAMEQRLADLALQRLHMGADGWLSDAELGGGGVEPAGLDHVLEHAQPPWTCADHASSRARRLPRLIAFCL